MSLLQKASIITTPTAYAEDYLYSIKPAYALNEVIINGNFDTDSNWDKSSGATISNGKANIVVTSGGFEFISQGVTYVSGKKYRLTATVQGTLGKAMRFQDNASNVGGLQVSNGTVNFNGNIQTIDVTWTANSNSNVFFIARNGTGDFSFTVDNVSVKEITDADFDFDRNSTGTRVNEDYLIEDVPYNLVPYSQDFSQWSKSDATITNSSFNAPDGTATASTLTTSASGGTVQKNLTVSNGNVTFSVFVKKGTTDGVRLRIDAATDSNGYFNLVTNTVHSSTNGAKIENYGNGWHRVSISDNITSFVKVSIYTTDGTTSYDNGTLHIWGAQIVKGNQPKDYLKTTDRLDIPRIDYTNGEPSILLEPSRTNTVKYSQDFSQYTSGGLTLTTGFLAPDGTNSATKVTGTIGLASLYRSAESSTTASRTIWARTVSGTGTAGLLSYFGNTDNLFTITEKWQRFEVNSAVATGGINFYAIDFRDTSQTLSEIIVWGAQSEAGSYATSLIHTSGSAVTRSADAANNAGNSDLINSTEGVLYLESKALANDNTTKEFNISDGTLANALRLQYTTTDNSIFFIYRKGSSNITSFSHTLTDVTQFNKIAIRYDSDSVDLFINGQSITTSALSSSFAANTLTRLDFRRIDITTTDFYVNCKMVAVFKEALSDTELEKLTGYNNHELYMNYYNRLSYLGLVEEYNVESDINNYIL